MSLMSSSLVMLISFILLLASCLLVISINHEVMATTIILKLFISPFSTFHFVSCILRLFCWLHTHSDYIFLMSSQLYHCAAFLLISGNSPFSKVHSSSFMGSICRYKVFCILLTYLPLYFKWVSYRKHLV